MQIPQNVIDGCKEHDRLAQQQLHALAYAPLMRVCMRYVKNEDDASSILSAVFFKILTKIDTYSYSQNFEAWMHTITINTALDYIKSEKKYAYQTDIDNVTKLPIAASSQQPLHAKDLMTLLRSLPIVQQSVFNLFAIEGYSHAEIATNLNISESNSKYLLHQARKALQDQVKKHYYA